MVLLRNGEELLNRAVSVEKAKEILREPDELSMYLKGVASPYAWINCDILGEGKAMGLLREERTGRRFVIDLDRNPPRKEPQMSHADVVSAATRLAGMLRAYLRGQDEASVAGESAVPTVGEG